MLSSKLLAISVFFCGAVLVSGRIAYSPYPVDAVFCVCGNPIHDSIEAFRVRRDVFGNLLRNWRHSSITELICSYHNCSTASPAVSSIVKLSQMPPGLENGITYRHGQVPDNRRNGIVNQIATFPAKFAFSPALEDGISDLHGQSRFRRFPKTCNDSLAPMKGTVITCWAWPNYLTCDFQCTHGQAMREGGKVVQKTTRFCKEDENYWKPVKEFPVCQPYIRCQTKLISPGNLNCKSDTMAPSYCDISCDSYEDQRDEIPMKRYECVDENYGKSLPRCASVDTKVPIIARPNA